VSVCKISFAERGVVKLTPLEREPLAQALGCKEPTIFPAEFAQ
jgi:hypothetical protein